MATLKQAADATKKANKKAAKSRKQNIKKIATGKRNAKIKALRNKIAKYRQQLAAAESELGRIVS